MAYFGVDGQVRIEELNLAFCNSIRQRFDGFEIKHMRQLFTQYDTTGNGKLDLNEFEQALAGCGLFPKIFDLKKLHQYYDVDCDGSISYNEFINALLPAKLSQRQAAIIEKAWCTLDKNNTGSIDGASMLQGGCEGQMSKDEFVCYFKMLAVKYPSDGDFVKQVSCHVDELSEDKAKAVRGEETKHLMFLLRQRLLTVSNESQEEYQIRNMFRKFDTDASGTLSDHELKGMLGQLGVVAPDANVSAMMTALDTNGNGVLEFEEFCNFVNMDPYSQKL